MFLLLVIIFVLFGGGAVLGFLGWFVGLFWWAIVIVGILAIIGFLTGL